MLEIRSWVKIEDIWNQQDGEPTEFHTNSIPLSAIDAALSLHRFEG